MESTSFFNERVGFGCHQGPFEKTESAASSLTPYGEQGGVGFGAIQLNEVRKGTQKTLSGGPHGNS